jgi:hypothetical protein
MEKNNPALFIPVKVGCGAGSPFSRVVVWEDVYYTYQ